jgi:hypothetical protein
MYRKKFSVHALNACRGSKGLTHSLPCGPGCVVGIPTYYGLDAPGIESRRARVFTRLSRRALGQPSLAKNGHRVCLPGVERLGRAVDHPPSSSTETRERAELHVCSLT